MKYPKNTANIESISIYRVSTSNTHLIFTKSLDFLVYGIKIQVGALLVGTLKYRDHKHKRPAMAIKKAVEASVMKQEYSFRSGLWGMRSSCVQQLISCAVFIDWIKNIIEYGNKYIWST